MANKQALLQDFVSPAQLLAFAHAQFGVCEKLKFVKQLEDGSFVVQCCMDNNPSDIFQGEGASKLEATADCIAMRFPD